MNKKEKENIIGSLLVLKAIRYVCINRKEGFYLIKHPGIKPRRFRSHIFRNGRYIEKEERQYDCVIVVDNKIISSRSVLRIKHYLEKYKKAIDSSPEFLVSNIIKDKQVQINSPKYLVPIKNLFREIGLIAEKRGKKKKPKERSKDRKKFVIQTYKDYAKKTKRKRPLPISYIHNKWMEMVNREEWKEKCYYSQTTIRRDLEKYLKK